MKKPQLRTGIVGAGFSARFHFEAVQRIVCANVDVVGVHARTGTSTRAFADKHAIEAFDNLDALLDSIDVLHVCVPPALHEDVAVELLKTMADGQRITIKCFCEGLDQRVRLKSCVAPGTGH